MMRHFVESAGPVVYIGVIWGAAYWMAPPTFFAVALLATVAVWARIVWATR
jgi:hypothetical protein